MRVEIIKNFITEEVAEVLNTFTLSSINKGVFKDGVISRQFNPPGSQMVTRFSPEIVFPNEAFNIQNKLKTLLSLSDTDLHTFAHHTSIVVNCSFAPARVIKHIDPKQNGLSLLRCNILSSAPEAGGLLHVEDTPITQPELSVYFCLVSDYHHYVTPVEGDKPRILWQFGFNVDKEAWESGQIKVQQ
jgi:hypothetical protein